MTSDTAPDLLWQRRSRATRALVAATSLLVLAGATAACSSEKKPSAASKRPATAAPGSTTSTAPEAPESDGYPSQPEGVDWPTEDWSRGPIADGVDAALVDSIVERAFGELSNDTGTIDAILVVQGGRLVVERYNNWDPEATHNSWSMAKSINSALVGILVGQGKVDIAEPFPAPEWQTPGDPRAAITWDQLLRMSSGLAWDEDYGAAEGDVVSTLGPDSDRAAYAASKPLAHEPGSTWSYSTGTANLIARGVADIVGHGDALVGWIDQELMRPLGIPKVKHNVDRAGVISGGSFIDLRPQDFARFGLLYARGGVWEGRRILPEGWVDYTRTPTPSDPDGTYGAQWWLMPGRPDVFYANGFNGQSISVVPARDLVVVVLSNAGDGRDNEVQNALLDAFGA
ncbi:MAG: serine hydrolase [Microthrixaceae bacterium]|nr:serine hydrolase [Microthrixaceae bacterium]